MNSVSGVLYNEPSLLSTIPLPDHVGCWDWDVMRNRVYTDDVVANLFGVDLLEASAGAPIERYEAGIHPEDRKWVSAHIHRAANTAGVLVAEYRTRSRNGVVRWVLARGRFYHDASGRPLRSHGIVIDVTDHKDDDARFAIEPATHQAPLMEHAADHALALREILVRAKQPFLTKLADMLLIEMGRELGKLIKEAAKRRLS